MKPDNILFDDDDNAVITDFGIATARFHGRLTMTGRAMGTPHYMSPEQAMGKMVDGRSDIYAMGVLLYEMLVGFPPFDGADSYSIGYKHVHEQAASPDVVNSRTPPELAAITMKCLAKNAAERYQTRQPAGRRAHRFPRSLPLLRWLPRGGARAAPRHHSDDPMKTHARTGHPPHQAHVHDRARRRR